MLDGVLLNTHYVAAEVTTGKEETMRWALLAVSLLCCGVVIAEETTSKQVVAKMHASKAALNDELDTHLKKHEQSDSDIEQSAVKDLITLAKEETSEDNIANAVKIYETILTIDPSNTVAIQFFKAIGKDVLPVEQVKQPKGRGYNPATMKKVHYRQVKYLDGVPALEIRKLPSGLWHTNDNRTYVEIERSDFSVILRELTSPVGMTISIGPELTLWEWQKGWNEGVRKLGVAGRWIR